jgi:hypothetical protein
MEISGIQIAITAVLILSAAGVALLCDFLKARNDQLQEAMAELQSRGQDKPTVATKVEQKQVAATPVASCEEAPAPAPVLGSSIAPVAEHAAATVAAKIARNNGRANARSNKNNAPQADMLDSLVRKPKAVSKVAPAQDRQVDRTIELTSLTGRVKTPPPPVTEILLKTDEMNSKDSLTDWLGRRAALRAQATQKIEQTAPPKPAEAPVEIVPVEAAPVEAAVEEAAPVEVVPVEVPQAVPEQITVAPVSSRLHEVQIDSSLWESLLADKPATPAVVTEPAKVEAPEVHLQLIRGAAYTSSELLIPAGMHDQSYLTKLLEINKPFTGLVVSISVSEDTGRTVSQNLMHYSAAYIGGLLGEKDFGCRTSDDEFVLICAGVQGAEAQRRLSAISERLWDFQLRGLGTFSMLFSWGGVDVKNESLSEAVTSATDRMNQTKRTRKTVSMDSLNSVNLRRKAV